ncbi:hypothetical protein [Rhodovastum atsumiense]|nr:hypothetical protein [Rhodovastum atsumiense]
MREARGIDAGLFRSFRQASDQVQQSLVLGALPAASQEIPDADLDAASA